MEKTENRCQIYLIVPGDIERVRLDAVIASDVIAVISSILLQTDAGHIDLGRAEAIRAASQQASIPLLLENDIAATKRLGADGVHIRGSEDDVARARGFLGDDLIVGASCDLTRHMAMAVSESGADYVAFQGDDAGILEELVEWWSDVTVVPCVGWDINDLETAKRLAAAGADFLSFNAFVWAHADGPAAAIREIANELSRNRAAA